MRRLAYVLIVVLSGNMWSCTSFAKSWVLPMDASIGENGKVQFCFHSRYDKGDKSGRTTQVNLYDIGKKPVYDNIGNDWVLVWSIVGQSGHIQSNGCFFYGEKQDGFTEAVPPARLQYQKVYRLDVSTPGERGTLHFRLLGQKNNRKLEIVEPKHQFE